MNPSRLFILRPVATSLLMIAILLVGIVAYRVLPVSALPTTHTFHFCKGASPFALIGTSASVLPSSILKVPMRPAVNSSPTSPLIAPVARA